MSNSRSCANPPRVDLAGSVEKLLRDVERETYARQCHHEACPDTLYRRGWNAATERIAKRLTVALAEYRLAIALAELRACDVDAISFEHAGEGG